MNSPLLCVNLILRNQDETSPGLQDVGSTIADFLGPGRSLSLHEACTSGSTKLLNWIWRSGSSSSVNCNASNWSLSSLLQSDCHYYQWQFSEALEVAVARGDLETVKWLFEHFKHCQVAVEVVEAAAWNGQLEILQYLLEHDAGVKSESMGVRVVTHTVHWGGRSLVGAVENGHADVAWWLHQHSPCGYGEADITNAIKTALLGGDMKLAEFLLPRGKFVLDYAEFCSHPDVVEGKLDCGYLQRDVFGSAVAMKDLSFHFSSTLSSSLAQYVKEILLDVSSKSNHKHIIDWMQEKYPVASGTTEEEQW
ncbi:Secreted RxLR effector protein 124 [Phytophthora ramorum]|uniref:Secreted RxLR effector protein 124 n=1 Tax=Phytophthora ramorum TaxID=164328 RepID=UPI0030A1D27D|nr:Secreted RxLR effector protein 124 [Phytophthora ramorum]